MKGNIYKILEEGESLTAADGTITRADSGCIAIMDSTGTSLMSIIDTSMLEICKPYIWEVDKEGQVVSYSNNEWGLDKLYIAALIMHKVHGIPIENIHVVS